jgi:hypothetical protein
MDLAQLSPWQIGMQANFRSQWRDALHANTPLERAILDLMSKLQSAPDGQSSFSFQGDFLPVKRPLLHVILPCRIATRLGAFSAEPSIAVFRLHLV